MTQDRKLKRLLNDPSIIDDVNYLKHEIEECFIDDEGNSILIEEIDIYTVREHMHFLHNHEPLFMYNNKLKELVFNDTFGEPYKSNVTELFDRINK
jgi:hypothetical protein